MTSAATSPVSWAERVGRATLLRVSEPAAVPLARHVRAVGVAQTLRDIRADSPIPDVDVAALRHRLASACGERDLEIAASVGARLVCPGDAEWSPLLADLARLGKESFGLWARGPLGLVDACSRSVAIVGTRTATDYGVRVAADFAAGLADRGWSVVSGLAYGIDGAAHRGALAVGGTTVAVLACGIDVVYPHGHRSLFSQISDSGLVVSEHPPGAAPQRHRFLVRNRIIAALSLGTVVVEMAPRSGARSTAGHAEALLRHVMVVPGPVTSGMSVGCHQLLRERPAVVLVTRADEIVEQCGHLGEFAEPVTEPPRLRDGLGPLVARVFDAVPVRNAQPLERIATTCGVRPALVSASLAALVDQGLVEHAGTGWRMSRLGRAERTSGRPPAVPELPLDWL